MSMTFYYAPMSSAITVHRALEELGVPYDAIRLDLAAGETRKPEFLAINPNGKVPALVHDGTPLFESVAILIHLGESFRRRAGPVPGPGPRAPEGHPVARLVQRVKGAGGAAPHARRQH